MSPPTGEAAAGRAAEIFAAHGPAELPGDARSRGRRGPRRHRHHRFCAREVQERIQALAEIGVTEFAAVEFGATADEVATPATHSKAFAVGTSVRTGRDRSSLHDSSSGPRPCRHHARCCSAARSARACLVGDQLIEAAVGSRPRSSSTVVPPVRVEVLRVTTRCVRRVAGQPLDPALNLVGDEDGRVVDGQHRTEGRAGAVGIGVDGLICPAQSLVQTPSEPGQP